MTTGKLGQSWTLITIFLIAAIIIGGIIAWSRYSQPQPIEIFTPPAQELQGDIYICGAVSNPGFYPLKAGDSIENIIQAAGGTSNDADLSHLEFYIPEMGEGKQSQKVDLNRAETWLLRVLPGIGETLAQRIVDYRNQNGPFRNIHELIEVEGIGPATYERIEHLITVAD